MNNPFISIQVPSNRPQQIIIFLDHLEKTANDFSSFEVIVNLDVDDDAMGKLLENEKQKRPFSLKYIKTFTGGFYNSWKPINDMLPHTHPNTYFLTFLSDEFLFQTKGWDDILKEYIGYYSDDIFRLRASQYRYRNYLDVWECGFAPDSISFYTKKWVDINTDWAPCFSSDSFQQFVAYYLITSEPFLKEQLNRDIPVPDLRFSGEGASIGLEGEKVRKRVQGGIKAWFTLVSYPMQVDAARRAMLLKANIIDAYYKNLYQIIDNHKKKRIELIDPVTKKMIESYSYKVNRLKLFFMRHYRKKAYLYYGGGGRDARHKSMLYHITYYLSTRYDSLIKLHDQYNGIKRLLSDDKSQDPIAYPDFSTSIKQPEHRNANMNRSINENPFFFITTYDLVTSTIISALLNTHPEMQCVSVQTNSLLPKSQDLTLDQFINKYNDTERKFSGNIHDFFAFELQYKTLREKTKQPFRRVNIVLSPLLRVRFLIHSWLCTGLTPAQLIARLEGQLLRDAYDPKSIVNLYHIIHYYNDISRTSQLKISLNDANNKSKQNPDLSIPLNKLFLLAVALVVAFDAADMPSTGKYFSFETLLSDEAEFKKLINYITRDQASQNLDYSTQYQAKLEEIIKLINSIPDNPWEQWQSELLNTYLNKKLDTIHGNSIIEKPLTHFYKAAGYTLTESIEVSYTKLLSIHLNSNRPAQLSAYFDNVEETADRPQDIEILVNIDFDDEVMKSLLESEIKKRKFTLKYTQNSKADSFYDLWKPLNQLVEMTDPKAYFVLNVSDETFFATKGWDTNLKKYVGFYPDHIFRLRTSRNKYRNYFDRWECNYAQDALPITTRKWMSIVGDWNPCFGPDSFQQMIAFYLAKEGEFTNENYLRDVPITDIQFSGDTPSLGISPEKQWKLFNGSMIVQEISQSYKMQLEARRRAVLLKVNILNAAKQFSQAELIDNKKKKIIQLRVNGKAVENFSYKLSWFSITLSNQWRKLRFFNYFGEGFNGQNNGFKNTLRYLFCRYSFARKILIIFALLQNRKQLKAYTKKAKLAKAALEANEAQVKADMASKKIPIDTGA